MGWPVIRELAEPEFKDPYYYLMIGMGWICAIGAAVTFWSMTPWFPWK